jgi:GNAT superfamily N-acetyltransferase
MRKQDDSPLQGWIDSAAVRTKPSLTDFDLSGSAGELSSVRWFVFGTSDELAAHPSLRHLGIAERNWMYAARLVHFLDDMTLTEHRIVNAAAQVIAENRLSAFLPERLALDALKLYTDEGYHAFFTAHASRSIRDLFGLEERDEPNVKIAAIEALVAETPAERRDMAWFMVGFVGETMITKAIVDVMRGTAHSAVQGMLLAHLEDEWVHAKYFGHLFALIWPKLDAESQAYFGRLLPDIIVAFHTWDERFHRRILGHVGLDTAACDRVLAKVASESNRIARMRSRCGNTLQVLERCGVFGNEPLRASFIQAGLLDRDRAYAVKAARKP